MRYSLQAAVGSVISLGVFFASACEGGPVLDWLFHRPDGTAYTAYSAPGTTPLPGVASDGRHVVGYAPGSPYATAPVGYAAAPLGYPATSSAYRAGYGGTNGPAPTGGSCGPGVCYETVLRYLPETSYRTQWAPVPVTQYTTTTNTNPATGLPITCTRPCTTYTWQARREPYTSFRPVYQQVPLSGDPAFAQPQAYAAQGVAADAGAPVRAFRPFGGLFSRDRFSSSAAPSAPVAQPAAGLAWGGMLPPATASAGVPFTPAPNTYAYAPNTYAYAPSTSGCTSCGGAAVSNAPIGNPGYEAPYAEGSSSSLPGRAAPQSDGTLATPWQRVPGGGFGQGTSAEPPYEPAGSGRGSINGADTEAPRIDPGDAPRELRQRAEVAPPTGNSNDEGAAEFRPNDFPAKDFPANEMPDFPTNNGGSSNFDSSAGTKSPTSLRALRDLHHRKPAQEIPRTDDPLPSLLNESKDRTASWTAPTVRDSPQGVPIARSAEYQPQRRDYRRADSDVVKASNPAILAVEPRDDWRRTAQYPPSTNRYRSASSGNRSADTRVARPSSDGGWHAP